MFNRLKAAAMVVLCATAAAMGQSLKVGDAAPSITVEEWVKGNQITGFEKGKVYVVEFWATWCAPCVAAIPHLTDLQKKHKDAGVTVIGVAASERAGEGEDKRLANLKKFVGDQGAKMNYAVAFDEDRSMSRDWMQAAGQRYIPTAFIVGRDGTIAWIGSPSQGLDEAVAKAIGQQHEPTAPAAAAQPGELKVGDRAPALSITEWVKGSEITGFEKGKVYVVEFWATWCGPCITSMPHLSALQREYKDKGVTIIGVTAKDTSNTIEAVREMVKDKGDVMGYTVAFDAERKTYAAWMEAADQHGIPTSFIVDRNGQVAFIGHPLWLDEPIEQVVKGTWDPIKGQERIKASETLLDQLYEHMEEDAAKALATFEKFMAEYPLVARHLQDLQFSVLLMAEQYPKAYEIAEALTAKAIKERDAFALNSIAWTIVDPDGAVKEKNLVLAKRAALKADEFSEHKNPAIIDTVARVYFLEGDIDKALDLQRKAVNLAEGNFKRMLEVALREYEEAKAKKGR